MRTDETDAIYIEVLAQGIVRMLEVLYSRSLNNDLDDHDYQMLYDLKILFHNFFADDENSLDALHVSGKYIEKLITPAHRKNSDLPKKPSSSL